MSIHPKQNAEQPITNGEPHNNDPHDQSSTLTPPPSIVVGHQIEEGQLREDRPPTKNHIEQQPPLSLLSQQLQEHTQQEQQVQREQDQQDRRDQGHTQPEQQQQDQQEQEQQQGRKEFHSSQDHLNPLTRAQSSPAAAAGILGSPTTARKKTVADFVFGDVIGEGSYGEVCME